MYKKKESIIKMLLLLLLLLLMCIEKISNYSIWIQSRHDLWFITINRPWAGHSKTILACTNSFTSYTKNEIENRRAIIVPIQFDLIVLIEIII